MKFEPNNFHFENILEEHPTWIRQPLDWSSEFRYFTLF